MCRVVGFTTLGKTRWKSKNRRRVDRPKSYLVFTVPMIKKKIDVYPEFLIAIFNQASFTDECRKKFSPTILSEPKVIRKRKVRHGLAMKYLNVRRIFKCVVNYVL